MNMYETSKKSTPAYFAVFTLALIALMYMFAFHNERSKHDTLKEKYKVLQATYKTVKEPICDE